MGWLTGFIYRKRVTLSRASGAVTNYQMKLLLGESSGATGEAVDCGGLCKTDFSDVRFTNADGTTLLDYWIESITGTTPNQLATIWIEFDSIGIGATTFYMYYGNTEAAAVSNGADTFILFDDFERGVDGDALGGTWLWYGTISTDHAFGGSRCAKLPGAASDWTKVMSVTHEHGSGYAIRFRFWKEDAATFDVGHGDGVKFATARFTALEHILYAISTDTTKDCLKDQWDVAEIRNLNWANGTFDIYYTGDALAKSGATMESNNSSHGKITFYERAGGVGNDIYIDNLMVRQWLSTEPAWGAWADEVVAPPLSVGTGLTLSGILGGRVGIPAPPLGVVSALAAAVLFQIAASPLSVLSALSLGGLFRGPIVAPDPLAVQSGISASMRLLLASPALTGQAALSGGISIQLPAPAMAVVAGISTDGVVSFIDRDFKITYNCVLSLAGLADLTIPTSSFQARFKSGDPSFLSVVVPGLDQAEDIAARAGGTLRVYMVKTFSDGNQIREMLGEVTNDDIRTDEGTENQSITIDGHKTVTLTPKTLTLSNPQYRAVYGGGIRYRCNPDFLLRPGDTVNIGDDTFQANVISWAVSVESQLMEISEL